MPALSNVTPGPKWISVSDAVKLIEAHTKANPTVDLKRMLKRIYTIKKGFNFTIFLMKRVNGQETACGSLPCQIATDLDEAGLKAALREAFKKAAGFELDETPVKMMENISEPDNVLGAHNMAAKRKRGKPQTKKGDTMISDDINVGRGVRSDQSSFTSGMEG